MRCPLYCTQNKLILSRMSHLQPPWPWPHLQDTVQVAGVAQVVQAHKRQHVVFFLTADKGRGLCCRNHLVTGKERIRVRDTLGKNHFFISPHLREFSIEKCRSKSWQRVSEFTVTPQQNHPKPHRRKMCSKFQHIKYQETDLMDKKLGI